MKRGKYRRARAYIAASASRAEPRADSDSDSARALSRAESAGSEFERLATSCSDPPLPRALLKPYEAILWHVLWRLIGETA